MLDLSALEQLTHDLEAEGEYFTEGGSVLVVDDDFGTRWTLQGILRRKGCAVSVAATGQEALEMVEEGSYDVVLLDLTLPDMSGLEVHRVLAEVSPESHVIFVTEFAGEQEDVLQETCAGGRCRILAKPIDLRHLVEVVREVGGGHKERTE